MLLYGNVANIKTDSYVFNLTSFVEGYNRLRIIPPNNLGASSDYEFDQLYANWIFGNDSIFFDFFTIINILYCGFDVYLIVSDDMWSENILESLLKLIQQRYGYNATKINCFDDLVYADPGEFNPGYGLFNLDQDLERFSYLSKTLGGNYYEQKE